MGDSQARRWCFTWNNYPICTQEGWPEDALWQDDLKKLKYSYIVVGKEVGANGTKHLQGYVEFKSGKRFSTIKKVCPAIHLEKCIANAKSNYEYCTKDGDFWEDGEMSEQGKRMDLEAAMADIKSGMTELNFFEAHPMVMFRYPKACDRYRTLCEKESRKGFHEKTVYVLWGDTGTGKTRSAIEAEPDAFIVSSTQTGLWWDGYDGEKAVILDEFRDNAVGLAQLLRVLDGYCCQVPIKGGSRVLMADTIYITSNVNPGQWYQGCDKKSRLALMRRISQVIRFDADGSLHDEEIKLCEREMGMNPMVPGAVEPTFLC